MSQCTLYRFYLLFNWWLRLVWPFSQDRCCKYSNISEDCRFVFMFKHHQNGNVCFSRQPQNSVFSLITIKVAADLLIRRLFLCSMNCTCSHIRDIKSYIFRFLWSYANFCMSEFVLYICFYQWDLVCDRKSLAKMTATIFFVGVMLGAILFGYLSDKYGVSMVI